MLKNINEIIKKKQLTSPEGIHNVCAFTYANLQIFVNICSSLTANVRMRRGVDTFEWHVYTLPGKFETNLSSFPKCHVDKRVDSDGIFNTFESSH